MKKKIIPIISIFVFFACSNFILLILITPVHSETEAKKNQIFKVPPKQKNKLLKWLKAGTYLEKYTPEPEIHTSTGPHGGNVRTYYNPILVKDLQTSKKVFRKGATMVKELYFDGNKKIIGYAVMSKIRNKSGTKGKGWLFYETFDATNKGAIYGRGVKVCASCHSGGIDYLLSAFRP